MLAALATGLATLLLLKKKSSGWEKPPKGAPQLNLNNPGSQDEFLKAPGESEIG
jgi:hypothetical protein